MLRDLQSAHSACRQHTVSSVVYWPHWSDCLCFSQGPIQDSNSRGEVLSRGSLRGSRKQQRDPLRLQEPRASRTTSEPLSMNLSDSSGSMNTQDQVWNKVSSLVPLSPHVSSIAIVHASLVSATGHKVLKNQDILAVSALWGHKGCSCLTCLSQVFVALFCKAQFFLKVQEPKTPSSFH